MGSYNYGGPIDDSRSGIEQVGCAVGGGGRHGLAFDAAERREAVSWRPNRSRKCSSITSGWPAS